MKREQYAPPGAFPEKRLRASPNNDTPTEPLKQFHSSWKEWDAYRQQFLRRLGSKVVVKDTESVETRNRRLRQRKRPASPEEFLPAGDGPYRRKYICVHGMRKGSKDSRSRELCCPFSFTAEYTHVRGQWLVYVHSAMLSHDHSMPYAADAVGRQAAVAARPQMDSSQARIDYAKANTSRSVKYFVVQCLFDQMADELADLTSQVFVDEVYFLERYLAQLKRDSELMKSVGESYAVNESPHAEMAPYDNAGAHIEEASVAGDDEEPEFVIKRPEFMINRPDSPLSSDEGLSPLPTEDDDNLWMLSDEDEPDLDINKFSRLSIQEIALVDITVMSARIENLSLEHLLDVLPTIDVQFAEEVETMITLGKDASFVPDVVPYLLPESLVDRALDFIPMPAGGIISLLSDDEEDKMREEGALESTSRQYVRIEGVGCYTAQQLQAMRTVWYAKKDYRVGARFTSWLRSMPGNRIAVRALQIVLSHRPAEAVQCHAYTGLLYSHVYRVAPGAWLSSSIFDALATIWARFGAETIILPGAERFDVPNVPDYVIERAANTQSRWVLLLLNIKKSHWTGIVVDKQERVFTRYDSLGNESNKNLLHIVVRRFRDLPAFSRFASTAVDWPIQDDGYSCGLFVCHFFWKTVDPTLGRKRKRKQVRSGVHEEQLSQRESPDFHEFRLDILTYLLEKKLKP